MPRIVDYGTINTAHLVTAKAKGVSIEFAKQTQAIWLAVQAGILSQASSANAALVAGKHAAIPAEKMKAQGAAIITQLERIGSQYDDCAAAVIAQHGYTQDEFDHSFAWLMQTAEMMRDTATDGSELATLVSTLQSRITAAPLL